MPEEPGKAPESPSFTWVRVSGVPEDLVVLPRGDETDDFEPLLP